MRLQEIEFEGGNVRYRALRVGHELWLHLDGETHVIDLRPQATQKGGKSQAEANGEVLAPMPGKILKVCAGKGEAVVAGQTLVVMEAMKMEYSLAAPFTGSVSELNVKEGAQVELNQRLAKVEKA